MTRQNTFKLISFYFIKSISFFPALISVFFILFAILMLHFERQGLSGYLYNEMETIIITHNETARTILSSIITGVISLTVFSFTMVMVVLSQTGSNFSPRLIPGLITYRSHQIILGFYLGTIIYSLIILINVESRDLGLNVPGTSILLSVAFFIISLGMFVYFIHSISQSIQIGNIMEDVYSETLKSLKENSSDNITKEPDIDKWYNLDNPESGYLQDFDAEILCEIAVKNDLIIKFIIPPGFFIDKGIPFLQINKLTSTDDLHNEINKCFTFKEEEIIGVNYIYGFKHLSEIAQKALSPAINDPGTATRVLNYFTELFTERMKLPDCEIITDKSGKPRIIIPHQSIEEMFSAYLSPVRNYGKGDLTIIKKFFEIMFNLGVLNKKRNLGHSYKLYLFADSVIEDAKENITNSIDREIINQRIKIINEKNLFEKKLKYLTELHDNA